ncbi:hypothetical protein [Streptomyces iconiensis]|uniref:Uncharacterized protein n=1 Tax=Streptomyces iconiensis TaxID=1384038 RepID=A0ABT6ZSG5_9ACTN|nr:hypothetical protein [Streptomyces iconiensis]MDJ1131984.1 hypothetical protein [Streptomyces iconiensis]
MPTPYGSRGGVAFSADELRVLGGALAIALQSDPAPEEARDYLRLAEAVEETVREGYRLRSFLLGDLARYREALPGAAPGYLDQLEAALTTGYLPRPDDLAALRTLCGEAAGEPETDRRLALLHRCESLAESAVRARLRGLSGSPAVPGPACVPAGRTPQHDETAPSPATAGDEPTRKPAPEPEPERKPEPEREPEPGAEPQSPPSRPVPTPGEVFPPRRRSAPHPGREAPDTPDTPETPESELSETSENVPRETQLRETPESPEPERERHPIPA